MAACRQDGEGFPKAGEEGESAQIVHQSPRRWGNIYRKKKKKNIHTYREKSPIVICVNEHLIRTPPGRFAHIWVEGASVRKCTCGIILVQKLKGERQNHD